MVANNADPNEMQHYGAMVFHQRLHCLTEKQTECRASMFTKFCKRLHEIQKVKQFCVHAITILIFFIIKIIFPTHTNGK